MTNTTVPTDAELLELADVCEIRDVLRNGLVHEAELLDFARAVLAKWGNQASANSVQEDAARWNAWASGIVEACNSDEQEPAFLVALNKAIGDAEPPVTLELLNAWTDAARKQGETP